ncbi:MAG: SET domain-containing protein-lysine N-methyltransferase [Ferrovibrio sp.]|uniref:SET domain-containing protein n=1 Tax=Ferrovibrio sp. TaxID=1917215 RepID=UPI00261D04CC|nr:SET domain-containing protein-lysine N-methyltransferase [Ferrovibrio sp.]MCW0233795.1 SET domain-containing protein-lysine N-methyltransferase [Ferrovibrio sp.]
MLLVPTYTAASRIQGIGLFAAEPIAKGTLIWRFEPGFDRIIPQSDFETLPPVARAFVDRYGYTTPQIAGGWVVSLDNTRFINHSTAPNTDNATPVTYAARDIAQDEEITCDYGEFCDSFELD